MSTGNITRGSTSSDYYYSKSWSGGDGQFVTGYVLKRPGRTITRVHKSRDSNGRPTYRLSYVVIPPKTFRKSMRIDCVWHNYTMSTTLLRQSQSGGSYPSVTTSVGFPQTLKANTGVQVQQRLVESVRGHSFNLGVAAAEAPKTVEMIASTASRIARSVRSLKHGDLASAARHLGASPRGSHGAGKTIKPVTSRDVADRWLELQYGWKPLLGDIHSGAQAMAYHLNKPRVARIRVRGRDHLEQTDNYTFTKVYCDILTTRIITCDLKEQLSTPRSLGLLDPTSVAWELLPFSFVADWFIPIGTYLDNFNIIPNISGLFMTTDVCQADYYAYQTYVYSRGAKAHTMRTSVNRVISSNLTAEKPEFIPSGISTTRLWSSIALLRQAVIPDAVFAAFDANPSFKHRYSRR